MTNLTGKELLLPAFFSAKGMIRQHIDSFNYFIDTGIKKILEANHMISLDTDENVWLAYKDIRVDAPSVQEEMCIASDITPHQCRLRDITYSSQIVVDVEYIRNGTIVRQNGIDIGRIPIMLHSSRCVLNEKNERELALLQECPLDPGGYFVVNGTERVILMQEQLSNNRILVELDARKNICATVTSSTAASKSRTLVYLSRERLFVKTNKFREDVPAVVVLKAMGVESDLEVARLVGEDFLPLMALSIEHCRSLGVDTEEQALAYIGARVRRAKEKSARPKKDEARFILISVVLSHLSAQETDFYEKAIYLGIMIRRVFMVHSGRICLDDKDYYGNKRLELAGQLMSILFEDLFKRFNSEVKRHMENMLQKQTRGQEFDAVKFLKMRKDIITRGFVHTISTGNWILKRFNMEKQGVTAVLNRLSFIASLGHLTRVSSSVEKNRKISGPRALQTSQWGMVCPSDTPEGIGCGLLKSLALMAHVTTNEADAHLCQIVFDLGGRDVKALPGGFHCAPGASVVFVNGRVVAVHFAPGALIRLFRLLRRRGKIQKFVSIYFHSEHRCVYLSSDEGRVCRPLIIVENGAPLVNDSNIEKLTNGSMVFEDFIDNGLIEYLDVNEENNALIALREEHVDQDTTHLEISEMTILGIVAGLIPFPHHNQSPRNTYQCAMGKQSMGVIGYNQNLRLDTLLFSLVYPQKPLVKTNTLDFIGFDRLPAGQNAIVAVMSYSGYDIEDAIVLNKASVERGFGRCEVYRKTVTDFKRYSNNTFDRIARTAPGAASKKNVGEYLQERLKNVDSDGFCRVGSRLSTGSILVAKQCPQNTTNATDEAKYREQPLSHREKNEAVVAEVMATSNEAHHFLLKILTRETRQPELGDKFSSRHGQKGVVGLIVPESDLPFNDMGMAPDIIMNPHGFPSRMTLGKMLELVAGKAALLDGRFRYGTAFGAGAADVCGALESLGFSYSGKDALTSGLTGERLECCVFTGPVYYQKLKHMVADKMHARARGPKTTLTRQPREGRSNDGGLRLGEMERDCLIAYGASMLLQERLCFSSDQYVVSVCRKCGMMMYKEFCGFCKTKESMAMLRIPYSCKLLFQELISMNIVPRIRFNSGTAFQTQR